MSGAVGEAKRDRTGAAETFDDFFQRQYERLARTMFLLTGDGNEAEELAQEAMVRIYERWGRVRAMDSPTGYLYRTAVNLNRRRQRRLSPRSRVHPVRPADAEDPALVAQVRGDVRRALASLSPGHRTVLVLTEWLDMDAKEAAKVLGMKPASVRVRLHRARVAFRERMGDSDG